MQLTLDRGERDVQDRAVDAEDEQAQAADGQNEHPPPAAEFGHGLPSIVRRRPDTCENTTNHRMVKHGPR
jgi:hypothetical protein